MTLSSKNRFNKKGNPAPKSTRTPMQKGVEKGHVPG